VPRLRSIVSLLTVAACLPLAVWLVRGHGVPGGDEAPRRAGEALARLGFKPSGDRTVTLGGDQLMVWALDRSAGERSAPLTLGEGGALRWRVEFSGGGVATVTPSGVAWSARRPIPTDPGPDLYPAASQPALVAALGRLVSEPAAWEAFRRQSWREGGHLWHRVYFASGSGSLPSGWRREIEIEMIGSTPVAFGRHVEPLGTQIGVVAGRVRELAMMRIPGLVGMALVTMGVFLAAARGWAFHFHLAPFKGIAAGFLTAALATIAGTPTWAVPLEALVPAAVVTAWPLWAAKPPISPRWGAAAGIVLAAATTQVPALVSRLGGWLPAGPAVAEQTSPWHLVAAAALPALVEEPLLRGALPGMLAPLVGWWGAAAAGAAMGAVLHTLPAVPLIAAVAVSLALQLALVALARVGGVGAAMLARFGFEAIHARGAYPVGLGCDLTALGAVAIVLGVVLWPQRSS
jgi:hypothetical protein